jgi:hypothetical protein
MPLLFSQLVKETNRAWVSVKRLMKEPAVVPPRGVVSGHPRRHMTAVFPAVALTATRGLA